MIDPTEVVVQPLAALLGGAAIARRVLENALALANVDKVPAHPEALLTFCSTHLLAVLAPVVESTEVAVFLSELQREVEDAFGSQVEAEGAPRHDGCAKSEARSGPRGKGEGLRVILVDEDATTRIAIARVLVRAGATVLIAADTLDEVLASDFASAHILVCDLDAPRSVFTLLELAAKSPTLAVVARADTAETGGVTLEHAGVRRYQILGTHPTGAQIVASVLTLWSALSAEGTDP